MGWNRRVLGESGVANQIMIRISKADNLDSRAPELGVGINMIYGGHAGGVGHTVKLETGDILDKRVKVIHITGSLDKSGQGD